MIVIRKHLAKIFAVSTAAVFLIGVSTVPASAGVGTGIGISIPTGGSSKSASPSKTYAAFRTGKLAEELTVEDRHGRLLMEFKVTNLDDNPYTVSHRNGQVYDFAILDKNGKTLYRWSDGTTFPQALATSTIAAHQSEVYQAELDRKAYRKLKEDAVLVTAWLTDTPYVISTNLPTRSAAASPPAVIHGGIILGNGHWAYDD